MTAGGTRPCRPWTLTLEVEHLYGPPFDLAQHGDEATDAITNRLGDIVLTLSGGTEIRIESLLSDTKTPRWKTFGRKARP